MPKKKHPVESSHKLTGIKVEKPADFAAGAKGVMVAMKHAVGEIGAKDAMIALAKMNQKGGFDCPGCAWPDPDDKRSLLAEYCENGAKALAEEATKKRVGLDFFKEHSIHELAHWSDYEIGRSGRLTHPVIKKEGGTHYEKISWEAAFELIGDKLNSLSSPNEASFYTSGRSSNEAAFLYGIFSRAFGTNNLPDCSNMCHESSGVGLKETTGIGKGSVKLEDFPKAELIIVIGQNPGTNHPRMLTALQECKLNNGKIISINPLEETGLVRFVNPQRPIDFFNRGTTLADLHLPVKINQDVPLLKAIMKLLLVKEEKEGGVLNKSFIKQSTEGFAALVEDLGSYDLLDLVEQSGVSFGKIKEATELIASREKIIICWAMGLTQHVNGVDNIKDCVNLLLLKGSIGIEGGGTCPVRGHSNVQGDRSVGIMHYVSKNLNQAINSEFGFNPPGKAGYDVVRTIKAMHEGKVKVFVALGGNLAAACSDTYFTAEAFHNCECTVHIATKLNRTHLIPGKTSIILPTLGRSEIDNKDGKERFVTVENSMGKVQTSQGNLPPAAPSLKSEPEIIGGIAQATIGKKYNLDWQKLGSDYDLIREKISKVINGFRALENIDKEGFYLANNAREGDFSSLPGGKAKFSIARLPEHNMDREDLILMTIRSHDQFNTTIYALDDRYRGIFNERRVLFMNKQDMESRGLEKLQLVNVVSNYRGQKRVAQKFHVVEYKIPKGNVAGYFPELNPVIPIDEFARGSYTPASKSIIVKVKARPKV